MTSKKAVGIPKKTKRTGVVSVSVDGKVLRLQFPSKVSQAIWGTKQKYKALGLHNTPENMAKAQEIAAIAQMDLLRDELDVTLEKYSPFLLEKTIKKIEPAFPKLLELCQNYFEEKIYPNTAPGTHKKYKVYLNAISRCPNANIIKDAVEIKNYIRQVRTAPQTRSTLSFLYKVVKWAQRNQLIPKSAENPYKELAEDVSGKPNYQKPQHIKKLIEDENEEDFRAYSPQEAVAIIEEFNYSGKPQGVYKDFVEFLFLTGCRTSEAIGLRWEDITDDCREIVFRHSFCVFSKTIKGLKTERYGKTSRKFPCGERLKHLLLKIRDSQPEALNPKNFVFNRNGEPLGYGPFYQAWAGQKRRKGLIARLIEQGKVKTYLKPYATRHSFITWQLKAGQTPANVAALVGNTADVIYKCYVSADEDARVFFEI
jgi:integrase